MKKNSQKTIESKNTTLLQKKQFADEVAAKAQAEYDKIIEESKIKINAANKILKDAGLVPKIILSEQDLLNMLKQMYKENWTQIQIHNPTILYDIQSLTESAPAQTQESEEVDYEIVDEKVD